LIILALVLIATATGAVSTVSAQAQGAQNATTTGDDGPGSAVIDVGRHLTVTDYEFRDGQMRVQLEADLPTLVTISGVLGQVTEAGAREIPQKQLMIRDTTTVSMDVEQYRGGAAVSVATNNGAVYLSTGVRAPNPYGAVSPTAGWLGGASVVVAMGVLAVRKVRGEGPTEPEAME
jgi:hypothetical protein